MTKTELREKLNDAISSITVEGKAVTGTEIRNVIHDAAVSGDEELKGLAAATAYFMVEQPFTVIARKHQDAYGRPEVSDFLGDLKVYILTNIEKYDPANSPYTWLEHRYMPVFQETKDAEYGLKKTVHETRVGRMVQKAKADLLKTAGNSSPTEMQVYDYLVTACGMKGKISIDAVRKAMQGVTVFPSQDLLSAVPDSSTLPEKNLMEKVRSEQFQAVVRKLSARSRKVILAEMLYNEENGETPSSEVLAEKLKETFPDASPEELQRYIFSAHNELRRKYRNQEEAAQGLPSPVNGMGEEQQIQMEEEERVIIEAIEEDASILDFL